MDERLERLRQITAIDDGGVVLVEDLERFRWLLTTRLGLGRFVRCADEDIASSLEDLLTPGFLLTRRIGELLLIFREEEGMPVLAFRGEAQHLVPIVEQAPGLRFVIAPLSVSWKLERIGSHLRIEGAAWTKFFPWVHVRSSAAVGCIVSGITTLAVWVEHGGLPPGPWGTQTYSWGGVVSDQVLWFLPAVAVPGGLAAATNFFSLCWLGPDRSRPFSAWWFLLVVIVSSGLVAVVLAGFHYYTGH